MKYNIFRTKKSRNLLYMSNHWMGKHSTYVAAMFKIFWMKKFHRNSVYMSFSFNWKDILRNKSLQKFNCSNDCRTSTFMSCRTSYCCFYNCNYKLHVIDFCWCSRFYLHSSSYQVLSIFIQKNIFCFGWSQNFFCHKFVTISLILFFASLFLSSSLTTYNIRVSGRD